MIDCVFLMLVYFMVTSTLEREEADLAFQLPGKTESEAKATTIDEQWIEIDSVGQVSINGHPMDSPEAEQLAELASVLTRFRQAAEAARVTPVVTIAPDDKTPHLYIIKVMDAIRKSGLEQIHFAMDSEAW